MAENRKIPELETAEHIEKLPSEEEVKQEIKRVDPSKSWAYASILNGSYHECIPCAVLPVEKEKTEEKLKEHRNLALTIPRVPRVLHGACINPQNTSEMAFYVTVQPYAPSTASVLLLLGADSGLGISASLSLTYNYFTHKELLKKSGIDQSAYQSCYTKVGGIIHLNLKDEAVAHKQIISKVLHDKIKDCTTVIRKASSIKGVFRNISIEHLAGIRSYSALQKENGLVFHIQYDKVYWNPKLQVERKRLVSQMKPEETLCDMFCGVGPFSILALARGLSVWANDLNPDSIRNFKQNTILNRKALGLAAVPPDSEWNTGLENRLYLHCRDARDFFEHAVQLGPGGQILPFSHYVLNLPEQTLSYLDLFRDAEARMEGTGQVHAYFFVRNGESARENVEQAMRRQIKCTMRMVRKVSPSKEMWLVSFWAGSLFCEGPERK